MFIHFLLISFFFSVEIIYMQESRAGSMRKLDHGFSRELQVA